MAKTTSGLVSIACVASALVVVPGTAEAAVQSVLAVPNVRPQHQRMADFDGDGKTDLAVWRPGNGTWYIQQSSGASRQPFQYGQDGDVPVPADYDGDGKADIAVFRPSTAYWYIVPSRGGAQIIRKYGYANNTPAPGDYDGDKKADLAVYTASHTWDILRSKDGKETVIGSGSPGDVPLAADYDGDGKTDPGEWRPSTSTWHYTRSTDGQTVSQQFGDVGSNVRPAVGDFDNDGRDDLALVAEYNTTYFVYYYWHVLYSYNGHDDYWHLQDAAWSSGHLPITGDFDGDGWTDTGMVIDDSGSYPDTTLGVWRIRDAVGHATDHIIGRTGDYPV